MRRTPILFAAALSGCQLDPSPSTDWPCGARPEVGVIVRPVRCADDLPSGAEGGIGDILLASPHLRAVVRAAGGARTRPGLGAGTLVDLARWDGPDLLHELIPLLDRQWLADVQVSIDGDSVVVDGRAARFPDLDATGPGQGRIRWSLDSEEPRILFEGATEAWLHPRGGASVGELGLTRGGLGIPLPPRIEDLGGALILSDIDALHLATTTELLSQRHPDGVPVRGEAPDATGLEWFNDSGERGSVTLHQPSFDLRLPPGAVSVRATAPGRAPSPLTPVGPDLLLVPGPHGEVALALSWTGRPHPILVRWRGAAGAGQSIIDARGGTLPTGPGAATLQIGGREIDIEVPTSGTATARVSVQGRAGTRLQVLPAWPGDRDTTTRRTDRASALRAGVEGADAIVLTARFDIAASGGPTVDHPSVLIGTDAASSEGWRLIAWPMRASPRTSAGGLPAVHLLRVQDAVAALEPDRRSVAVPLVSLGSFEPWVTSWPRPTHVLLPAPERGPALDWAAWLVALRSGVPLLPLGPVTWIDDRGLVPVPPVSVDRALTRGALTAGDGPDLTLRVAGLGPGDRVPAGQRPAEGTGWIVELTVLQAAGATWLSLITDEGLVAEWPLDRAPARAVIPGSATAVSAVAWTPGGGPWATTGPIWLRAPIGP